MKRNLLFFLMLLLAALQGFAADMPIISTAGNEVWYYLKFKQGPYVVASNGANAVCRSAIPTAHATQLWKVEGAAAAGYTFTNKAGLQLYYASATQGGEVRAAEAPASNTRFKIIASGSYYTISPATNTAQSMNCWGGMGLGNDIKFYDRSDANAPMEFVGEDAYAASASLPLIPYPQSLTRREGTLPLRTLTAISYDCDAAKAPALKLAADLQATAGLALNVTTGAQGPAIVLATDESLAAEAYRLTTTADGVSVKANGFGGFFNALQTLRQLLPNAIYGETLRTDVAWELPLVDIEDAPMLAKRGFMLDISRHFFDKKEVKKLLDVAAIYKLNHFHWHLTDDQGWRIEIPEYPRLTTVGAVRSRSLTLNDPTNGVDFYDDTEYGRGLFYTLDDLREIVAYAQERNIEILPEIDLPGHMVAAIAAYPWLSCDSTKQYEVRTAKGISTDVLNVGDDRVIDFLKCVLGHVAEVFPGKLIHIGGDECPTGVWKNSDDCARRLREEGLGSVDDLQPWLAETLGNWLRETYGKDIVVWDELMAHWKDEYKTRPVIMGWNGLGKTTEAVKRGFRAICVPTGPMYLDLLQAPASQMEIDAPYMGGYGDGSVNSTDKIYALNPLTDISEADKALVIATQGNLWTESCHSNEAAEYCYYPRLLAVSETGWLPAAKKNFADFYTRLQSHDEILALKHIRYAPYYIEQDVPSAAEALTAEAAAILAASRPGCVGFPSQEVHDALQSAFDAYSADNAAQESLAAALEAYKTAEVKMPEAGKNYRIRSASLYWRQKYDGAAIYADGSNLKFHYTPQAEPEELFHFLPQLDGTWRVQSVLGKGSVQLSTAGRAATLSADVASDFSLQPAPRGSGKYTYLPGVLTLKTGNTVLYANTNGQVVAGTDETLCHPGTWRIEEVTDYASWLEALVAKSRRIIEQSRPGEMGEPSQQALDFLTDRLVTPATAVLGEGTVTEAAYREYAELYAQFLQMPRASVADGLREDCYYYIRNGYHTTRYAYGNKQTGVIDSKTLNGTDNGFRWAFRKNADGTVGIINKLTGTAAYVQSDADGQSLRTGREYAWTLREITTDTGNKSIAIIDGSGAFSWYTNPSAWSHVLLKPYDWGASVWMLEPVAGDLVPVRHIRLEPGKSTRYYDLHGRLTTVPSHGVYVRADGLKVVK